MLPFQPNIMAIIPQIRSTNLKVWTNRHETFKQPIADLFDISNGDTGNMLADYNATTLAIGQLIDKAVLARKTVRALGGGWSFTRVAATNGWMANTKHLNMRFTISEANIDPAYTGPKDQLLFAQCGNSVQELNDYLRRNNRSLKTSGASNGQTIIGAISTGTHGAAIDFGSTQDFVVGLHIILGAGHHIWLERASHPVVSRVFIEKLKTVLIRDDGLFNAALLSFGSFGFIHGAMLETEPLYLLECYRQRVAVTENLRYVMNTLDFSHTPFAPHGTERPFHFQVVVNPYDIANGLYVTRMFKRPFTPDYQPWIRDTSKAGPGDDAPAFLGKLTSALPALTHVVVDQLVKTAYAPFENVRGTLGEIFYSTDARGKIWSTAFGIPISHVGEAYDLLLELIETVGKFAGVFAFRYVQRSAATLAFARWAPTCVVEIDGVEAGVSRRYYDTLWQELKRRHIPHAFHWGKMHNLAPADVQTIYGDDRERWILARNRILTPGLLAAFTNETLVQWGLHDVLELVRPV
jgi:FAD/FMN-containing dehydrogenase